MSTTIRVRVSIAVIQEGKILLVPHYKAEDTPVQWFLPGGAIEFGEAMHDAARREFLEETGFHTRIERLLDVSEVIRPAQPWHSVTITFSGTITGGTLTAEQHLAARYGDKTPRWFSRDELQHIRYHPPSAVEAAFACLADECA